MLVGYGDSQLPVTPTHKATAELSATAIAFAVIDMASVVACAYHGYKRNNSVGWAIGWGLVGGMFPLISVAIAVAEGFGKPKSATPNRRKRSRRRARRSRR